MTGNIGSIESKLIVFDDKSAINPYKIGTVVSGLITEKSEEGTLVEIGNKTVMVPSTLAISEAVGQQAEFEVIGNDMHLTLKYLESEVADSPVNNTQETRGVKVTASYEELMESLSTKFNSDEVLAVERMIQEAQKAIKELNDGMGDADLKQMMADGLNPRITAIEVVAGVLKNNKPLIREHSIDKLSGKVVDEITTISKNYQDQRRLEQISDSLSKAGVPVRKNQMDKILGGIHVLEDLSELSSTEAADLLGKLSHTQKSPTLEHIYSMMNSASGQSESLQVTDAELDEIVKDYLEKTGLPVDEITVANAKLLIKEGVPVSSEALDFVKNPESLFSDETVKAYTDSMAEKLSEGTSVMKIIVDELIFLKEGNQIDRENQADTERTVDAGRAEELNTLLTTVGKMTDGDIARAVLANKTDTLEHVAATVGREDQGVINTYEGSATEDLIMDAVTFKRQIVEIQLKMTLDVAMQMEKQGIQVDTAPIEEVLERLEAEETAIVAVQVKSYSPKPAVERTIEMVERVKETMNAVTKVQFNQQEIAVRLMKDQPGESLGDAVATADVLHEEAVSEEIRTQLKAQKAESSYEASMTEVRSDLGDRIEKTFSQIESILKDMGIEMTDANVQAVESLARNSMVIDEGSIWTVQLLQEKIDQMTEKLTPTVAVKLIHAGINPMTMSLDELNQTIQALEEEAGQTETTKISEMILGLDQSGEMTSEERQAMMALYRSIDTVSRSKGAAAGFIIKQQMSLSVDSLFEAAKYIRKTRQINPLIHENVDDDFGMLEEISNEKELLKSQISDKGKDQAAQIGSLRKELMSSRISSFIDQLSRSGKAYGEVAEKDETVSSKPLEELTQLIRAYSGAKKEPSMDAQTYLSTIKSNPAILRNLIENRIPLTFDNFSKAIDLDKETYLLMDQMTEMFDGISEQAVRRQAMEILDVAAKAILEQGADYQLLKTAIEEIEALVRLSEQEDNPEVYRSTHEAKGTVSHLQMIQVSEDYYQIPVLVDQQISQLNMYIMNQKKAISEAEGDMTVLMSLEAGSLGSVQALMTVKGNGVELKLQSTYPEDKSLLERYKKAFSDVIESTNYHISGIHYQAFNVKEPVQFEEKITANPNNTADDGRFNWAV